MQLTDTSNPDSSKETVFMKQFCLRKTVKSVKNQKVPVKAEITAGTKTTEITAGTTAEITAGAKTCLQIVLG